MVLEIGGQDEGDTDYAMNSAVSTESMDMEGEDMSQVDGCLSGASDDDDDCASSPAGSNYDDSADLIKNAMSDEVTKQLAAAGPVGMAAAAAIASSKKRKRPHSFETNPSVRKRHQNRLLRKLRQTIEEFATRVGQQAVVLVATPGKPNTSYRVFGAKPLEDVVRNLRCMIMEELENALAQQAPAPASDDPSLFELPPLIIDGIPTPVEKMTQAQLRAFIPLMLKYSMVRGKPGWGRESTRPPWWPKDLPWANVRMDARTEDEKQKMSWTHALRQIVINCYKYHGREDLLPAFTEEDEKGPPTQPISACMPNANNNTSSGSSSGAGRSSQQQAVLTSQQVCIDQMTLADVDVRNCDDMAVVTTTHLTNMSQYAPAVLQTITNPDGTVSLIQVDPNNPIITLPDGTTAQVIHSGEGGAGVVQTLDGEGAVVDLNAVAEATLNHDGQIILTGEDGHGYPVSVSGVITVPVSASVYQSMVASMQQQDGVCVAPLVQFGTQVEQGETLEALGMGGGVAQVMLQAGGDAQVLQVLSLKDAQVLTKAMQVKAERDAVVADS
ncbi:DNA-binding protein P3A2 isoform X4 [Helicoverpa armigera]|uniref:DNA-binding protein P3A2 isoform X4 n=1 Tax=Helicoverpa zea TaxID=7113 RepID=UPI000B37F609|nr:DNA-binding protein P3A2 isoform X4 [Helicoverpa zea]XP_049692073.1 DNA-binding protein P3A2 isoform X4 [Helicoverpa armigera]XP_049692083.1 DNA-binding protein P3A2-like isoform X4 [Helicoverpa armigera]